MSHNIMPVDWTLLPLDKRVLVAVSGGADSIALLHALREQRALVVAHVNHGLRGAESDGDEEFVRALCERLNVTFTCAHVEVAQRNGHFSEAEARAARYGALLSMAREYSCPLLATGHTASDNLETVLLNLLRGATVEGLGGIKPQSNLAELIIVRPLWQATREEARTALQHAGWTWREDSSNTSTQYARNRIRQRLVPLLGDLSVGGNSESLARQVAHASALWRDDVDWMNELARHHVTGLILREEPHLIALNGLRFSSLSPALQRRVLREAARLVRGNLQDIGREQIETVRRHIMDGKRRAVWQWGDGLNVEWTGTMAGNRIRFWLVDEVKKTSDVTMAQHSSTPPLL